MNYAPPEFVTSALTRSKVDLTWDETPKRREALLKKMDRKEMINSSDMVQVGSTFINRVLKSL